MDRRRSRAGRRLKSRTRRPRGRRVEFAAFIAFGGLKRRRYGSDDDNDNKPVPKRQGNEADEKGTRTKNAAVAMRDQRKKMTRN